MDALAMTVGIWLALPVPLATEIPSGKHTLRVAAEYKRPPNKLTPVEIRDGFTLVMWAGPDDFDDLGTKRLYLVTGGETPQVLAGWQVQWLRLHTKQQGVSP